MTCECEEPGFCERHKCEKTIALYRKCLQGGDFWEAWEQGRGPAQTKSQPVRPRKAEKRCQHRSNTVLKIAKCGGGCANKPVVYQCNLLQKPCMAREIDRHWSEYMSDEVPRKPVVCSSCSHRFINQAKWQEIYQRWSPPGSSLLVVTVATGAKSQEVLQLTGPQTEQYAKRCGADFVQIIEPTQNWWGLEKFRVGRVGKLYDRTLYLDADVWVNDNAPNLFTSSPPGSVYIHSDVAYQRNGLGWANTEVATLAKSQSVEPWPMELLNSGVVLFDRDHCDMWSPPNESFDPTHCSEQHWIEGNLHRLGYPIQRLHRRWNTQWYWQDFARLAPIAHFVHLANATHRERLRIFGEMSGRHPEK